MKRILFFIGFLICAKLANAQPWQSYSDTARQFEKQRNYKEALRFYERAKVALPADSAASISNVELLRRLGENNFSLSKYIDAQKYLTEGLAIFNALSIKKNSLYAILCDRLGRVYEVIYPKNAKWFYIESKNVNENIFTANSLEYAASCNSLGNYYFNSQAYELAESMHLTAKKIKEIKLGIDDPDYARSCNNLAAVYLATNQLEKAEPLVLEAWRIRAMMVPVKAHPVYAITCINLANIYRDLGQYEKAEVLYIEAKAIRARLEPFLQHADYAASCNILADFYSIIKAYNNAEPLYKEAMLIREMNTGIESLDYAESCNNLATLYTDMGKYADAEKLALNAKDIWDKTAPAESPEHAINRNNLGQLYYAMGQYQKALQYFLEARKLWEKEFGTLHPFYIDNTANIAKVYWGMKQYDKANLFYIQALQAQRGQVNKIFRFTSEAEKQEYIYSSNNFTDEFLSFYYKVYNLKNASAVYDRLLLNRNLILSSSVQVRQAIYNSHDTVLKSRYDEWISLKKELTSIYTSGEEIDSVAIENLEQKANDAEKWLTLQSVSFKKMQQLPDWKTVQQQLKKDEAAIEFTSFQYYNGKEWTDSIIYAALLIRKDFAQPLMIPLFEKRQLDSVMEKAESIPNINGLYSRGAKGNKLLLKTKPLYDIVWKPIEKQLAGIKKIYFAAAGDLFKISFSAMAVNEKQVLSDLYELNQLNSTVSVGEIKDDLVAGRDSVWLYGGILYEADTIEIKKAISKYYEVDLNTITNYKVIKQKKHFNFLPGTLDEVNAININATHSGYYVKLITGTEAVEESFKIIEDTKAPAVLHIATHGFFDESKNITKAKNSSYSQPANPLINSGLLFAGAQNSFDGNKLPGNEDGIVTALEISNMYLPGIKLVVLSACETALGDIRGNEGVYGLQRAFKIAGADYLLMSLWEVGDFETAQFMKLFYGQLFLEQPVDKAFLFAQKKMKDDYRKAPEKWGAWVLVR